MGNKIGLITYHSAYNYGSALQAYATQAAVENLGWEVEIINYRMLEQKQFYSLYRPIKFGVKRALKDLLMIPVHKGRRHRQKSFELFFSTRMRLSKKFSEPDGAESVWNAYRAVISGSDQIWNKHSCELDHNVWKYMDPYLLKGYKGRKISYASSVGNMTDSDLQHILPELQQFDALSFRETVSAEKIANLLDRPVETVLDPTLLLTKSEWISRLWLKQAYDERYILAYFLCGPGQLIKILPVLEKVAQKRDCKIKLVMPFAYLPSSDRRVEYHHEYGPIEFLNALYNAEAVVTDSYHGTILSVNFGKEFYSICRAGGSEFRKTDILSRLGLQERVVADPAAIPDLALPPTDYAAVYTKLEEMRQHSIDYLKKAVKG